MAQPRWKERGDPTVPEEATDEPHILSEDEEVERAARREEQQEHAAHPIWPMADYPLRQAGEMSPPRGSGVADRRGANLRGVIPEPAAHRAICARCRRPESVCYCAHLVSLPTRTRVLLLQHPRERNVPIGTARLAHLCLPGSELHVGVDFDDDEQVRAALAGGGPTYLLFPGPNAIDLAQANLPGPITLVVVDGTWWQARKLLKRNAALSALPQIRFTPRAPSNYRIRREPADHCVATVEALAQVLGALEGDPERFARAAAAVRGDDRHAAALRAHGAGRAPAPRRLPRTPPGAAADADLAARTAARRRLSARRGERLAGTRGGRSPRRDRALDRAPSPHRRDVRGDHRAAPAAGARDSPTHPHLARTAGGGRALGRLPRALGGVDARRRRHLRVGPLPRRPHGGGRRPAAGGADRRAPGGGLLPGRAHGFRRGLHGAPRRRRPGSVRDRPGWRAPGRALGDRRDDDAAA